MSSEHDTTNIDKKLKVGMVSTIGFTIFEFTVGLLSGSLVPQYSDAGHNAPILGINTSHILQIKSRVAKRMRTYGYTLGGNNACSIVMQLYLLSSFFIFFMKLMEE